MKSAVGLVLLLNCVISVKNVVLSEDIEYFENKYIGNPDDFAEIERPCPVYDLNCIRQFFAKHSNCIRAEGPLPDNIPRSQYTIYFPYINTTVTQTNAVLTGFNNTRIEDFYINRATNNVVFAVEARNTSLIINNAYFQFHRRAREPVVAVTTASIYHSSIIITAVIPNIDDMQLEKAEVTEYLNNDAPPFTIGPEVANNPDPAVIQSVAELYADVPTAIQEAKLTELLIYIPAYIQYNICDFGLPLI